MECRKARSVRKKKEKRSREQRQVWLKMMPFVAVAFLCAEEEDDDDDEEEEGGKAR